MRLGVGIVLVFCFFQLQAQVTTPKYSNEFLSLPVGARAMGMGGVQTASTSGAESVYWNPSFLHNLKDGYQISLMHLELYGGVASHDFIGFAARLDSLSAIGFAVIRLGVDNIPDTRYLYDASGQIDYDQVRQFSVADYAALASYSRIIQALGNIQVGANIKIIHRGAQGFATAWGFGLDVGLHYEKGNWVFGAMGRDITGTFNVWNHSTDLVEDVYASTGNTLPENSIELTMPKITGGIDYKLVRKENWSLHSALDLLLSTDGRRNSLISTRWFSADPRIGMEYTYKEKLFVRSGLSSYQQTIEGSKVNPHFGIGVTIDWARVDYALTRLDGFDSGLFTHAFSLNISLNEGQK